MPNWFYNLNIIVALLLFYIVFGIVGFISYKIHAIYLKERDPNSIINFARQTSLTFGAVFIAFWIVINWQSIDNLNLTTKNEAGAILNLYNNTRILDNKSGDVVRLAVKNYLDAVVSQGFESLEQGEINYKNKTIFESLQLAIYSLPVNNFEQKTSFYRISQLLDIVGEYRSKRLDYADGQMNGIILAFFIVLLLNICIWNACIFHPKRILTVLVLMSQYVIVLTAVWLIFELDRPFQGYFKIDNRAYIQVQNKIKHLPHLKN